MALSRRVFLKKTGAACAGTLFAPGHISGAAGMFPDKTGYSTLAWPAEEFEHALETISGLGFAGVQLVGWARERYKDRVEVLRDKLRSLNLSPVAQSCWGVPLDPGNPSDDSATFRAYADFSKRLGGSILQVTDQGKPDGDYSAECIRLLGERINVFGRVALDHGLELGYHPHIGSYGEREEGVQRILGVTDAKLVKLIADTGHLYLGGMDPAQIIRTYRDRLILIHLKDARKDAAAAARTDRSLLRDRKYVFCEIGQGALDFSVIQSALNDVRFRGWTIVELDGNEPAPGGPDVSAHANRDALRKLGW